MKMKHFYLNYLRTAMLLLLCGLWARAVAAEPQLPIATDDHIAVSAVTLVPGSSDTYRVEVSLVGSQIYTACQMDILFPPGLEPVESRSRYVRAVSEEVGGICPEHTIASSYGAVSERLLRITCYDGVNTDFDAASGPILYFNVKASSWLRPGDVDLQVSKMSFVTKQNAQKYTCADQTLTLTATGESSVALSVSAANHYSTCVLPFAVGTLPQGVQAYSARCMDDTGSYVVLEPVEQMAAYTPYILYTETGYAGTLQGTVDASQYVEVASDGYLRGAVAAQKVSQGYVLQNQGQGTKFYTMNGTEFSIPEGKCWLSIDTPQAASAYGLQVGGTTGVNTPNTPNTIGAAAKPAPIYSLDGCRVTQPQLGQIYIVGGRKVLKIK